MSVCFGIITDVEAVGLLKAVKYDEGGSGWYDYDGFPFTREKLEPWIHGRAVQVVREFLRDPSKAKLMPQLVALCARETSDKDFLQVSVESLHAYAEGKVDEDTLNVVLTPGEGKSGLLFVSYQDERIASELRACLLRDPSNHSLSEFIRDILSGKTANGVLENQTGSFPEKYVALAADAMEKANTNHGWKKIQGSHTFMKRGWFGTLLLLILSAMSVVIAFFSLSTQE